VEGIKFSEQGTYGKAGKFINQVISFKGGYKLKILQEAEVFEKVKGILSQVVPDKAKQGMSRESSLANDLGVGLFELMTIMTQVQTEFISDKPLDESKLNSSIVTVGDLCKLIVELSKD
jgi:acyl carrier protein